MPHGRDACMHILQMLTCIPLKSKDQLKCDYHELKWNTLVVELKLIYIYFHIKKLSIWQYKCKC
jgi:hypothetical protein